MDRQAMMDQLSGCYLAIPAFYHPDLALNLDGLRRHIRFLTGHGFRRGNGVLLINGATGDFPALTMDERKQTVEAAVQAAEGRIAVIAGGQALNTREAVEIARHAQSCGAAALQVSPPFYFQASDDDVLAFFSAIAEAAPELGIVYYSTYWLGYRASKSALERLAEIPQVVGVKWGSPDYLEYQWLFRHLAQRLAIIDNQLLPVFNQLMGGRGINVHPALFWPQWGVALWEMLQTHRWEEAQAEVNRVLLPYYDLLGAAYSYSGGEGHIDKMALELVGLPGGPNRPPTRPLPPRFKEQMRQFCVQVGVPLAT